jgi:hypothetical protein
MKPAITPVMGINNRGSFSNAAHTVVRLATKHHIPQANAKAIKIPVAILSLTVFLPPSCAAYLLLLVAERESVIL